MSSTVTVPKPLQQDTVEAKLVKQKIWSRMWRQNEHFMAVIVGREGSGKSHTGIKLSETVDPSFDAERVMFDPINFLRKLQRWKENNETQGKMVVIDEAGVGVGVRTWHDKAQIRLNQVLQIIRDENMGVIFTLPRLEELDSQTKGRLHAFIEMTEKKEGEWVKAKWLDWDPTRDGRNKIYREYPKHQVNGVQQTIKRLCLYPAVRGDYRGVRDSEDEVPGRRVRRRHRRDGCRGRTRRLEVGPRDRHGDRERQPRQAGQQSRPDRPTVYKPKSCCALNTV